MQKTKLSISLDRTDFIKGLAIIAVVLLHILPYPKGIYHGEWQLFFVGIDQLARFCVPAFLFLSGYGLAYKYQDKSINYLEFIKSRLGKLLPLYLIWSFASIIIVRSVPNWVFDNQPVSLLVQLALGQADYQLYFVIVLFQFYLLFPLIWKFRRYINFVFIFTLLFQIGLYYFYAQKISSTERFEYVAFISWINYFVMGIYLQLKAIPKQLIKFSPLLAILSLIAVAWSSLWQINHDIDPLPALKFTRIIIMPFAIFSLIALSSIKLPNRPWINYLGKNSYLIFLAHTIGLRIGYAIYHQQLDAWLLGKVILMWLATIYLSNRLLQRK